MVGRPRVGAGRRADWERRGPPARAARVARTPAARTARSVPAGRGRPPRNFDFNRPIDIRANPDLALALDVAAGSARVTGMTGKISGSVSAGSAAFTDVRGPFDFSASAGSLSVTGPISRGDSRITCDIGSLKLRLEPGADVRIKIETAMSKPDVRLASWGANQQGEWIVGDGTASLLIQGSMSGIKIREA